MVSIVIPALNEEGAIGATVKTVLETMTRAGIESEVLVVNDGSTDKTGEIAEAAGAKVITHLYNVGYGQSLKDGIQAAAFDTIVITDADGTYPIDRIPDLLTEYQRGFDMVVGKREGTAYHESWLKKPLRQILRFLVEFTSGRKIPDVNSGLRVFSKSTVLPFFDQLCNTFSFTTSLTLAYFMTGKYVSYLPISYQERVGETKVRLFKDTLRTLQYIVQAVLYYNPIKLFILFCGVTIAFSGVCLIGALILQLNSLFLLGVGGILVSFLIFSIGLLADQLRQLLIKVGVSRPTVLQGRRQELAKAGKQVRSA